MKQRTYGCIINPAAGQGYPETHLEYIKGNVKKYAPDTDIRLTKEQGHGAEIAKEFIKQGIDTILVAGGDGTVNEVGSVLISYPNTTLGVISGGTGNDYNYAAGFPDRFQERDWETLFAHNTAKVDVGVCNGHYFFNGMGIGFDAAMSAESQADRIRTGTSGKGRYTWIILKTLFGYKEHKRTVTSPSGTKEEQAFMTTIALGRRFAGTYLLTPYALTDDGLLDICNILPISIPKRLQILLKVPKGTHIFDRKVKYGTCKSCLFEFENRVPAHLDGELIYDYRFDISIRKHALNLIIDPQNAAVCANLPISGRKLGILPV